jgi:hypothetical protein
VNVCLPTLIRLLDLSSPTILGDLSSPDTKFFSHIIACFQILSFSPLSSTFCTSIIDEIVRSGGFSKAIDLLTLHITRIKNNKSGLSNDMLENIMALLFNISIEGSLEGKIKNTRHSIFCDKTERLLIETFNLLSSKKPFSSSQKELDVFEKKILKFINVIVINIHKGEVCPSPLLPHLSTIHMMMLQRKEEYDVGGADWAKWSKIAWEGIINGDILLKEYEKKK